MNINILESALIGMGYSIKKKTTKTIDIVVDGDRIAALNKIATEFGGRYNPKGGSSSIGRTEFPDGSSVNAKPSSGGSGAGSDITTLAESAQCVYCASVWKDKDFSKESFKSVKNIYDIDTTIDKIIEKLPEHWVDSCVLTARTLFKKYGTKNYTFHRGSNWVNELQSHWKILNRKEQQFSNINKWSPADIYMVSEVGSKIDLTKTKSIMELNNVMIDAFKSNDIIGVSLKITKNTASISVKNVSSLRPSYKFASLTVGKKSFEQSGDSFIMFVGGEIQFRTFGSTWQGEIGGKNAKMGKISGGPINVIMKNNGIRLLAQNEIIHKSSRLVKEFYKFYKHFEKTKAMTEAQFESYVDTKDQNWWVSKFLSTQLMYYVDKHKDKDAIVSAMIGYAASESLLSGPYIKVS
jgi:hypothetical protein